MIFFKCERCNRFVYLFLFFSYYLIHCLNWATKKTWWSSFVHSIRCVVHIIILFGISEMIPSVRVEIHNNFYRHTFPSPAQTHLFAINSECHNIDSHPNDFPSFWWTAKKVEWWEMRALVCCNVYIGSFNLLFISINGCDFQDNDLIF